MVAGGVASPAMADETGSHGAGDIAPDGSPVVLYRKLPPGDEPEIIDSAIPPRSEILELGAGAGRITRPLIERGHAVVAVDQSPEMLAYIKDADCVVADIETLDLGRQFPVVLLASHLVNTHADDQRQAFLATCRRHVGTDGVVLIERHEPGWAESAHEASSEQGGVRTTLTDVRGQPPYISAVMVYEIGGEEYRQPFTARVLDDEALAEELRKAGLRVARYLNSRWLAAEPI